MRLHACSRILRNQVIDVVFVVPTDAPGPILQTTQDLVLTLDAALDTYEVIEASPEERRILARWGHPFGGVQWNPDQAARAGFGLTVNTSNALTDRCPSRGGAVTDHGTVQPSGFAFLVDVAGAPRATSPAVEDGRGTSARPVPSGSGGGPNRWRQARSTGRRSG